MFKNGVIKVFWQKALKANTVHVKSSPPSCKVETSVNCNWSDTLMILTTVNKM